MWEILGAVFFLGVSFVAVGLVGLSVYSWTDVMLGETRKIASRLDEILAELRKLQGRQS